MELPHWLIAVGAALLVIGFVGTALRKNAARVVSEPNGEERDQPQVPPSPPSAAAAS